MKIAVVANSYQEAFRFVRTKFVDEIVMVDKLKNTFTLRNEDVLYLCYNEMDRERYISMIYDAFIVVPGYVSLLDTIIRRQMQ
jgi:hypothetical protein